MNKGMTETGGASTDTLHPIDEGSRIVSVDCISGIAVLGILLTNITAFSFPVDQSRICAEWFGTTLGRFVVWASLFLVEGKFYSIFSFLFGLGVAVQLLLSRWWVQRYLFGPVEWLWRSLAYGRPQPMLPGVGVASGDVGRPDLPAPHEVVVPSRRRRDRRRGGGRGDSGKKSCSVGRDDLDDSI